MHTRDSIQDFLATKIAGILGMAPSEIDVNEPFETFALNSIAALDLVGSLEQHLERPLPPTIIFDCHNIAALSDFLVSKI